MRPCLRLLLAAVAVAALPSFASANGGQAHIHISDLALERMEPGELRDLIDLHLEIVRGGSIFPDSGYAVSDGYGEIAHWEPFVTAYVEWLRGHYADLESAEALEHRAFVLGAASHGMADQYYDRIFLRRIREVDGDDADSDAATDVFLIVEHDKMVELEVWAPEMDLLTLYAESLGYDLDPDTLSLGVSRIGAALSLLILSARRRYEDDWTAYPWAAGNYYLPDVRGSLQDVAETIELYWQAVDARILGTDDPDQHLVLRTVPADGEENVAVDRETVDSWVSIPFGYGIDEDTLNGDTLIVRDPEGTVVPTRVRTSDSMTQIQPDANWAYDTVYTVEIGTGITTLEGKQLSEPQLFSFRTRCSPDALDDCPPLPEPWTMPSMPPVDPFPDPVDMGPADLGADAGATTDDDGGCSVSAAPSTPLLVLALLFFRRRATR